ncbi:Lysosomal Pro-X carboxypeptidase, partial [Gryllus bimaculatus]
MIVTSDFNSTSHECMKSIQKSWKTIDSFAGSESGRLWLNKNWKLCKPLNKTEDGLALKAWLSDVLVNLAMVNYPYPSNFLAPLPAYPI